VKCIVLFSGGLDSILATRLMLDQGLEVEALHLINDFHPRLSAPGAGTPARRAARLLGVPLHEMYEPDRFLAMLRNPQYGYGSNLNPCIDCRLLLLTLAKERMAETGARFVVTGEVVGERPMSQRRDIMLAIEKRTGLTGYVVRPLSAQLLPPSIPESEGWVDRTRLLAIRGRSRKPQMALAEKFGIRDYPTPAGGCLLTDPTFAARVRDLLRHEVHLTPADIRLLKVGRHFRLAGGVRVVVGRNERENEELLALAQPQDYLLDAADYPGPTTLVRGEATQDVLREAAALTARYGKGRGLAMVRVLMRRPASGGETVYEVAPASEDFIAAHRIGS